MPGVNFERLRNEITMDQVLNLIGIERRSAPLVTTEH